MVHSDIQNIGSANVTAYRNPDMDRLVDELVATSDSARQDELQKQIGGKIADDLPFIALFSPGGAFAYRPDSYDQWAYMQGVGILPRTSFLPGYASAGAAGGGTPMTTGSQTALFVVGIVIVIVIVIVAAVVIVGFALNRRARKGSQPGG